MTTWIEQLAEQHRRLDKTQRYIDELVLQARISGETWTAIGAALGVTKQTVQKKYAPLVPALHTASTAADSQPLRPDGFPLAIGYQPPFSDV